MSEGMWEKDEGRIIAWDESKMAAAGGISVAEG